MVYWPFTMLGQVGKIDFTFCGAAEVSILSSVKQVQFLFYLVGTEIHDIFETLRGIED